ncbi:MAG: hypothetical protein ACI9MS_003486 [Glaciecola sp.]|jgi:hypothetical protein
MDLFAKQPKTLSAKPMLLTYTRLNACRAESECPLGHEYAI